MKIILAGYSSELISMIKKCDLKVCGIVEPNKNVKIIAGNAIIFINLISINKNKL